MISHQKIRVVNIDLDEENEVTTYDDYHYDDEDCLCCNDDKVELAEEIKEKYLYHHKVIESSTKDNHKNEKIESMTNNRIKNGPLAKDMIAFLEKDVDLEEDDIFYMTLDKREHRYIIIYNCRNSHSDQNDLIIYESRSMHQFRINDDFKENDLLLLQGTSIN
jgi:hypothetical protein